MVSIGVLMYIFSFQPLQVPSLCSTIISFDTPCSYMLSHFLLFKKIQAEDGKLNACEKVKVKISGDGARMTRLTNYVILSYCMLDDSKDVLAAKGI